MTETTQLTDAEYRLYEKMSQTGAVVGQSIPYHCGRWAPRYLFGLPDVRACTPKTEADPWIEDVGSRLSPPFRIKPYRARIQP